MKKIWTTVLCVCLLFNVIGVVAAEEALVTNASFEAYTGDLPDGWSVPVGTPGEDVAISEKAYDGKASLRLFGKSANAYVSQEIKGMRIGTKYTLSFAVLREGGTQITSRIDFAYTEKGARRYADDYAVVINLGAEEYGKWVRKDIEFTVPPKTETVVLAFRKEGSADVCFDDISITGGNEAGDIAQGEVTTSWHPKEIENSVNLVPNNSFEELENDFPKGWARISGDKVFLNTDKKYVHSGDYSVRIATSDTSMPWVRIPITDTIVPGAEYEFSAWICTPDVADRVVFKTEFYVTNMDHLVSTGSGHGNRGPWTITKDDGWVHITGTEVLSDHTDTVWLYVRMYGATEVYVDDVGYSVKKGPEAFNTFLTDEVFYYSDWEGNGSATVTANTDFYPEFVGNPVTFSVLDREMVLYETTVPMPENGIASFEYPLTVLADKMKEYTVRCAMSDTDGNLIAQVEDTVFKVDRPAYITKEGFYVENGKQFDPVYLYALPMGEEEQAMGMGVNLAQGYPVQERLDLQASLGVKSFVVLYKGGSSGESAGHPNRLESTIENVKKYKDHPAVFGWALMDEPTPNAWQDLKKAYIEIRKIDPNHPIFITMNSNHATTGRFADVISSDSYPYGLNPFTTQDFKTINRVVEEVNNRKPVYNLMQAFDFRNSYPTEQEIRSMIYQSYWAGAKGIGFYSWLRSTRDAEGNEIKLPDTHLWEPLKSFYELEYQEVLDHFVYKKYPTFNEVRDAGYRYRSWVKDGKISLVILNDKDKEDTKATVRLVSADGQTKVGNFTASVVNGASSAPITGSDGVFSVTLTPGQAILYSIDVDADLSGIVSSGFSDMYNHGWAEAAVKNLNEKNILHTNGYAFSPGENVTRAEFAYMLMRALEVPQAGAEDFADVTELDYFMPEIRSGRAAGLLQGLGENIFGVDLPITRQDLTVMCLRAAQYVGKMTDVEASELSGFSDAENIADYAREAVSKAVGAGLLVGNADGTVNPQGNATRAEAAVIINRLMQGK